MLTENSDIDIEAQITQIRTDMRSKVASKTMLCGRMTITSSSRFHRLTNITPRAKNLLVLSLALESIRKNNVALATVDKSLV
jgi:hypothetical protein